MNIIKTIAFFLTCQFAKNFKRNKFVYLNLNSPLKIYNLL